MQINLWIYQLIGESGYEASGQISNVLFLRSENERLAYMLERSGKFEDPKIFDLLFYKNKSTKKGKWI